MSVSNVIGCWLPSLLICILMITILFSTKISRIRIDMWAEWFPQFCVFLQDSIPYWFLILRQAFIMHHAIAIEESRWEKPSYLTVVDVLFSVLALRDVSVGLIELWSHCQSHTWFVISYDVFEQIWIVVECRQHLLFDVQATLFSLQN